MKRERERECAESVRSGEKPEMQRVSRGNATFDGNEREKSQRESEGPGLPLARDFRRFWLGTGRPVPE